jgi:hypothetical protein
MQSATLLTKRKPIQRNRNGEIPEGLSLSRSVACVERNGQELARPHRFLMGGVSYADGGPHMGTVPDTGVCRKTAAIHAGKPTQLKKDG